MDSKKVNWIFFAIILVHIVVVVFISVISVRNPAYTLGIIPNFILSQSIILAPALVGVLFSKENLFRLAGFHKIRISTMFMIILFTLLSMPLTGLINAISMLFVDNTVAAISGEVLEVPFLIILFIIGIFGPFSEELVFRGIIYQGYKRTGTALCAMVLSALLFALMHMNFNQAAYAFAIGLMVALLVEATGSIWSSILFHMFFNSQQVCMMYLYDVITPGMNGLEEAQEMLTKDMLLIAISGYLVIAAITTTLAGGVLVWIAKNEKRECVLRSIWTERRRKNKIEQFGETDGTNGIEIGRAKESAKQNNGMVTIPLLIGIVIALSYMSLEIILVHWLS